MQTETAVAAAFVKAGYNPNTHLTYMTIAGFIRQADGNLTLARRWLVAAAAQDLELRNAVYDLAIGAVDRDMRGETLDGGLVNGAGNGLRPFAPVQQPHDGVRAEDRLRSSANDAVPSTPSPNEREGGQRVAAGNGQPMGAFSLSPGIGHNIKANPPRGAAAIASVQPVVAKTLFDTLKIRGVAIGDMTIGDAKKVVRDNTRESLILQYLVDKAGKPADPSDPLRKLVKVNDIEVAVKKAEAGK